MPILIYILQAVYEETLLIFCQISWASELCVRSKNEWQSWVSLR